MFFKGYRLERHFENTFSNFDLDGMPMNMARHNKKTGTTAYYWVKRNIFGKTQYIKLSERDMLQ